MSSAPTVALVPKTGRYRKGFDINRNKCLNHFLVLLSSDGCVLTGDDSLLVCWLSSTSKPGTSSFSQTHSSIFIVLAVSSILLSLVSSQPVQLSAELEGLLLSMCEDMVVRRTDLLTVLETCELHHRASMLPPPERLVRQLVEDVYRNSVSGFWFGFNCLGEVTFGFEKF